MLKKPAFFTHLAFICLSVLLLGCEASVEDQIAENLVASSHPIDRKIGEIFLNQIPKEPIAMQSFSWKPMNGTDSKGYVILAKGENIFVSEVYQKGGLYQYTKFQLFPDSLIKTSIREFDQIANTNVANCAPLKFDDPELSTAFYSSGKFNAFSLRYFSEISCNTSNPKAEMLVNLSQKFNRFPDIKE